VDLPFTRVLYPPGGERLGKNPTLACQKRKGKVVEMDDVSQVYGLFLDVKRSTQYLMEYQSQYMFHEVVLREADGDDAMQS
jgi:RuvB-like protein 2